MSNVHLKFNPNKFSKNFWRIAKSEARYLWLYGGSGSGKTFSALQVLGLETYMPRAFGRTIYVLKEDSSRIQSTLIDDIFNPEGGGILDDWGVRDHFHFIKKPATLINKRTGVKIVFMGVDKLSSEKVKGLTNPHIVFVDEISDYPNSKVYDQLLKRVRIKGARFIFCFNPISEDHWIKKKIFDKEGVKREIIRTTYKDNCSYVSGESFVDEDYIEYLEGLKYTDENAYRVYTLGEFGSIAPTEGRFYKMFDINKHVVKDYSYDKDEPLHVTFDFNVNPYMTRCIWQGNDGQLTQIDEICAKNPDNTTPAIVRLFARKYQGHKGKVFVYGDPAGKAQDTRSEKGTNDFTIIHERLKHDFDVSLRVASKAEMIKQRGAFINALWEGKIKMEKSNGVFASLRLADVCHETRNDYLNLVEDKDGKKYKEKVKNEETKVMYEKYGHTSDANDYFFCWYFSKELTTFKRGSRKGFKYSMGR